MVDIIRGWYYRDLEALSQQELQSIRQRLSITPKPSEYNENPETFLLYEETESHIGVPLVWGLSEFQGAREFDLSDGFPIPRYKLPDPNHPSVLNPDKQREFMAGMEEAAHQRIAFNACAATGSGKSVCGLRTAAVLGKTTLILVHRKDLLNHWYGELKNILGVPDDKIGLIHGSSMDYEDKHFCVGIYNSVTKPGKYPDDFYSHFGTIIYDEVHKVGTQFFNPCAYMFNASTRIGLTATIDRADGMDLVYRMHFGDPCVVYDDKPLPIKVIPVRYVSDKQYPLGDGVPTTTLNKLLSQDENRNGLIARIVKQLHDRGRQILVVTDFIDHIFCLRDLLIRSSISEESIGLFIGSQPSTELSRIKKESQIILATYGMVREGTNIPRLDAGVDAIPKASATQLIGRIRRPQKNKPKPLWYTIIDESIPKIRRKYYARLKEYKQSYAEVVRNDKTYTR